MGARDRIAKAIMRLPLAAVEHGESAMPGGKLWHPGARGVIEDYASRSTPLPPIHVIPPDEAGGKWMIEDGSYRLEAAKLRGQPHIEAYDPNIPLTIDEEEAFLKGRR